MSCRVVVDAYPQAAAQMLRMHTFQRALAGRRAALKIVLSLTGPRARAAQYQCRCTRHHDAPVAPPAGFAIGSWPCSYSSLLGAGRHGPAGVRVTLTRRYTKAISNR